MARTAARPELLTVAEAADQLRLHRGVVYRLINSGELPSIRYPATTGGPGVHRIRQTEIDKFLTRCEKSTA